MLIPTLFYLCLHLLLYMFISMKFFTFIYNVFVFGIVLLDVYVWQLLLDQDSSGFELNMHTASTSSCGFACCRTNIQETHFHSPIQLRPGKGK